MIKFSQISVQNFQRLILRYSILLSKQCMSDSFDHIFSMFDLLDFCCNRILLEIEKNRYFDFNCLFFIDRLIDCKGFKIKRRNDYY